MTTQFRSLDDRLDYLYGLQRLGIKKGLGHTRALLRHCNNPQNHFPAIHIAGTNGKGSTSALLASILSKAGYRTGLYTSPHLVRFNERVRVNGVPITDDAIIQFVDNYRPAIEEIQSTFFETTTALAFSWFAEQNVDVAVIETGLGGRLDSTNVVQPELSVITPVAMDHQHILGLTLRQIAREKAGIIKRKTPVITVRQNKDVAMVIRETAHRKEASVIRVPVPEEIEVVETATRFFLAGERYSVALPGYHQAENASIALTVARTYQPQITQPVIQKGLDTIRWPGRMQCLSRKPLLYYDVAHNAHGIHSMLQTLASIRPSKPVGLLALKGDKDIVDIAGVVRGRFSRLIVSSLPDADLIPAETLARELTQQKVDVDGVLPFSAAITALATAAGRDRPGVIFGSHYIGKAVFSAFEFPFDTGRI
ncbi:MAG: bifunctional folylpolyglutamate synthase/dihydrofolate synthase [Fidelibacterota bacterium]